MILRHFERWSEPQRNSSKFHRFPPRFDIRLPPSPEPLPIIAYKRNISTSIKPLLNIVLNDGFPYIPEYFEKVFNYRYPIYYDSEIIRNITIPRKTGSFYNTYLASLNEIIRNIPDYFITIMFITSPGEQLFIINNINENRNN